MKRILVPIDFSKEAEYAAKVAASIARKTKSELYLLHMLELPVNLIDPAEISSINTGPQALFYMKQAHEKFDQFIQLPFFKGIKVIESVQFSMAFAGIIDESKNHKIDMIVMGSQGATGLQEMFIGSNTEKVVRRSHVPVLVVKSEMEEFKIKNMVYATDFGDDSKKEFQKVIDFADIFGAKIHFLYVNTIHNFNTTKSITEKMNDFITDFKIKDFSTKIYNDISVENGILNYTEDINADLIALNTHGRSGLARLFSGSVGAELTNHAIKPVITFKV